MIYKPHFCNGACNGAFISLLLTPLRRWEWYITCTKCFAFHVSKFEILKTTWKNKTKSIKMLDVLMKNWKIRVWCSLFHFFMRFAWFQILKCEPQSIWCKFLALSWLYHLEKKCIFAACPTSNHCGRLWSRWSLGTNWQSTLGLWSERTRAEALVRNAGFAKETRCTMAHIERDRK